MSYVQQNPILIDTVLGEMFRFTDYETLKICRLVCHKWKELCERKFFKKTVFVVKHYPITEYNEDSEKRIIIKENTVENEIEMQSIFESVDEDILFTATFKFELSLLTANLKKFYLEPNKALMTRLELNMTNEPLLGPKLDDLLGPNLRELIVRNDFYMDVSLDKLIGISEEVDLECVNIHKRNCKQKISSKILSLDEFNIISGVNPEMFEVYPQMTDIVDFGRIQSLYLNVDEVDENDDPTVEVSYPILNLSDCQKIQSLMLYSVIVNLDAQISPRRLTLRDNYYTKNGKDVQEFKFCDYFCSPHFETLAVSGDKYYGITVNFSEDVTIEKLEIGVDNFPVFSFEEGLHSIIIDFSLIPKTIKILVFDETVNTDVAFVGPIDLPKLKSVSLHVTVGFYTEYNESSIFQFKDCPSLEDVSLKCKTVNTDDLPVNIKRLSLENIRKLKGSKILKLDVLVVCSSTLFPFSKLLIGPFKSKLFRQFKANLFVFTSYLKGEDNLDEKTVVFLMKMKNEWNLGDIAFGPVKDISEQVRQKFALPECIANKSSYYVIKDSKGMIITKEEFEDLVQWD